MKTITIIIIIVIIFIIQIVVVRGDGDGRSSSGSSNIYSNQFRLIVTGHEAQGLHVKKEKRSSRNGYIERLLEIRRVEDCEVNIDPFLVCILHKS